MDMTKRVFGRRDALLWAGGLPSALFIGGRALGQDLLQGGATGGLLDAAVPDEIAGVKLPSKSLNLLRIVREIVKLEKEADRKGLPFSPLAFQAGQNRTPTATALYPTALPRLVALIDRSEGNDPEMADEAGALLAEVHASEHAVPEALKPDAQASADTAAPPPAPPLTPSAPVPLVMSRAKNFAALRQEYRTLFDALSIRPAYQDSVNWQVKMLAQARARYEQVGKSVGVPWYFIGAIHGLEASFNFRAHLHNGDFPLKARTRQVPSGRPLVWLPPDDWESSAKDALRLLGFTGQSDWTLERTLYRLEAYNGFGYRRIGVPTPYLWAYSNHYDRGKFVADGKWNAKARSQQCGAAVLLKAVVGAGLVTFPA
jgi:lysozyme family protein